MASKKQIEANQQNAQKSTGPKNTEKTRFNALKHGFRGKFLVHNHECQQEYDDMLNGLLAEWNPQGLTAFMTVTQLAQAYWLQMRAVREDNRVSDVTEMMEEQHRHANMMADYRTKAERSIMRLIRQLEKLHGLQERGLLKPLPDEAFRPELLLAKEAYDAYMQQKVPQLQYKPTQRQYVREAQVYQVKVDMMHPRFDASKYPADVVRQADLELGADDSGWFNAQDDAQAS